MGNVQNNPEQPKGSLRAELPDDPHVTIRTGGAGGGTF
jgi:hypothetical protein